MACHYSCFTCSGSTYLDLCLTCPSTRKLIGSACECLSDMYEYQMQQCSLSDSISGPDYSFTILLNILYFIMLVFSWLIILGNLNHLYSSKIRCMITFCQLISLILNFRYRFTSLAFQGLSVLSVWNFRYFDGLFCSQKGSMTNQCSSYQNLYGPLLTLSVFLIALIVSFIMAKTCIFSLVTQNQQTSEQQIAGDMVIVNQGRQQYHLFHKKNSSNSSIKSMTLWQYLKISFRPFLFLYIDFSVIQWTVQLSKIVQSSRQWSYVLYGTLILLIIAFVLYFLSLINSQKQFNVDYRSRMGFLYIFDSKYYLNYLDYLFLEQKVQRQFQSQKQKGQQYVGQRFYPQSNYIIFQIVIKFLISATTIIMFEYKPQIWVIPSLIVMIITFNKLGVFMVYERLALLIYYLGIIVYFISVLVFWVDKFFNLWIIVVAIASTVGYFILLVSDMSDWTRQKQGRYWQVAFQYLDEDVAQQPDNKNFHLRSEEHEQFQINIQNDGENSFNDLIKARNDNNILDSNKNYSNQSEGQFKSETKNLKLSNNNLNHKNSQQPSISNVLTKTEFNKSKLLMKQNQNVSQKNSIFNAKNETFNSQNNSKVNISQKNLSQNLSQKQQKISQNESFMSRTNRVRFAQNLQKQNPYSSKVNNQALMNKTKSSRLNGKSLHFEGSNLPQIEEDKQQSVEEKDSQLINQKQKDGQELSGVSLLGPQNQKQNQSYQKQKQNLNDQKIFGKSRNKLSNQKQNIFEN